MVIRDITERMRAAEALKSSEARFRQLAENIREVFWMTDVKKKRMIYISPGYESLWGRTCDSLYAAPDDWMAAIYACLLMGGLAWLDRYLGWSLFTVAVAG